MKKGFTLIELLVVITIIAILAGAALPYVQNYVDESRQAKAKSDLDEIARALIVYESREGSYEKATVEDLTGRYLDRSPIDPWGVPYIVATESGIVYSCGPDRRDVDPADPTTDQYAYDNIEVSYVPPLALVSVKWVDKNKSGAVDTQNVQDELHLTFSRKIASITGDEIIDAGGNLGTLLGKIEIYRDPANPDTAETLDTIVKTDEPNCRIVGASKTIVLPLMKAADGPTLFNDKYFIAGQDKIAIADNHNYIKDNATPQNNCISNQKVVILPQ
ncbi:MAG: prepilin-type N-terminal cleavage/methylation domain-containing protein [Candidatus Riflebacteria bacterium]|nr:prepilin-type N-terminal cleavage/methylation domain-containing protein [Candidatus Riflebacteria bacterium]